MQESPADNSAILIGVREYRYEMTMMEKGGYVAGKQKGTLGEKCMPVINTRITDNFHGRSSNGAPHTHTMPANINTLCYPLSTPEWSNQ